MRSSDDALRPASSATGGERAEDAFGFRNRGFLGGLLLVPGTVIVLLSRPTLPENSIASQSLNAAGWSFFLLYVGLRLWSTLFIGGRKDRELQTAGPYSLCRNPLYCGSFSFSVALACFLKSVAFGGILLLGFFVYLQCVVWAEEHFLQLRFGEDYSNYCRRTPRFWPRFSAFYSPSHVRVDLKRLKAEAIRLCRAALFAISLQLILHWRMMPSWPHWFRIP